MTICKVTAGQCSMISTAVFISYWKLHRNLWSMFLRNPSSPHHMQIKSCSSLGQHTRCMHTSHSWKNTQMHKTWITWEVLLTVWQEQMLYEEIHSPMEDTDMKYEICGWRWTQKNWLELNQNRRKPDLDNQINSLFMFKQCIMLISSRIFMKPSEWLWQSFWSWTVKT